MKSFLKKIVLGIHHPKEYITAAASEIQEGLNCFIRTEGKKIPADKNLLFFGYSPLVMGWIAENFNGKELTVSFERKDNGKTIAHLVLQLVSETKLGEKKLFLFKGISSGQKFESRFHQLMFRLSERLRKKHAGNINLDPELYNQVKIAYSIPREIKLITLENENGVNIFPTDLHGSAGNDQYVISLRHDKKACAQVLAIGKIALWTINAGHAKEAYALGKNHSHDLTARENHSLTGNISPAFHFPEPHGAIGCEELILEKEIADIGIHRVLLFRHASKREEDARRLVHLHRAYVQWHVKNGFPFKEAER